MRQSFFRTFCQALLFSMTFLISNAHALEWIDSGWAGIEQGKTQQALQHWQDGVNQLDDEQLLIVLGLYHELIPAIDLAKKAGRKNSAFIIQAPFKHQSVYYALSSQSASLNSEKRQQQLALLRKTIGVTGKLYSNSAIKFKSTHVLRTTTDTSAEQREPTVHQTMPHLSSASHHNKKPTTTHPNIQWLMLGNKTLKQNLGSLLKKHNWKLVWEIEYDYLGGVDVALQGTLSGIVDKLIIAYANRGVLLKATWFEGNQVLLMQRVFSAKTLNQVQQ